MPANFVVLTTTTPTLADALVYHLRQAARKSALEANHHVLTSPAGMQVQVRISQALANWMACSSAT